MKNIQHTLGRERDVANKQLYEAAAPLFAGNKDLKDHPRMQQFLQAKGLDDSIFDYDPKKQSTRYRPDQEAGIKRFMDANDLKDRDDAINKLKKAGKL